MKTCLLCNKEYNPVQIINGKRHILYNRKFCFDCSPFYAHNTSKTPNSSAKSVIDELTVEEFNKIVEESKSRNEILFKLKLSISGHSAKLLNRRLKIEKTDTSHFIKGGELRNKKYSNEEIYVENSHYTHIKDRFFDDKIVEYKCSVCNLPPYWNNSPLVLQLDHINGNRYDNRIHNLRWLCPNCHTQTNTFGNKFPRHLRHNFGSEGKVVEPPSCHGGEIN